MCRRNGQHQGGGPRNALGHRPEPAPASRNEPRGSQVLRLAASRGGGPETRSGTVQSLKCCPCQQKRAARLPNAAPGSAWQHEGGGPRNALGHRPEPEVLPLPAETSREAPKCCAWQGPETRSGTVQSLKCCPCQQKRAARLPSAAPGSIKGGGPETRSGTVQSREAPKCCAWQHQEKGPETRSGTVQSLQ